MFNASKTLFCTLSSPSHVQYYFNVKKFLPFLKIFCRMRNRSANSLAWSVNHSFGHKLLFVFPLTNAQLDLTKRKMSSNGSANVKHGNEWWDNYCYMYVNSMCWKHFRIWIVFKKKPKPSYEMNAGSWQTWVLITWCMQWMNIKQNNKLF